MEFVGKKLLTWAAVTVRLERGILEMPAPLPTIDDANRIPELWRLTKGMVEGANKLDSNVPYKADVGTLMPAMVPPDEARALGGILPGAKTYAGNVLNKAEVGTLTSPCAFATKVPPEIRIPVCEAISIEY